MKDSNEGDFDEGSEGGDIFCKVRLGTVNGLMSSWGQEAGTLQGARDSDGALGATPVQSATGVEVVHKWTLRNGEFLTSSGMEVGILGMGWV